jgi:putative ABC transport system substrate-binding protein
MRRRDLLGAFGGLLAWPSGLRGEQKLPIIGYFGAGSQTSWRPWTAAFLQRLRELDWIEGRTVAIEYRWAEGQERRYAQIAEEFVGLNVSVIVTAGTTVPALKRATSSIPIVFAIGRDPVGEGLVKSLGRPGGNVTGLSTQIADLAGKRLSTLREVVPSVHKLAILTEVPEPAALLERKEAEAAARQLGMEMLVLDVRDPAKDISSAFEAAKGRSDAMYVGSGPILSSNRTRIFEAALATAMPTISGQLENVRAGSLVSYGPDYKDLFRRPGDYVNKLLRGARPSDLPVEQPTKFELAINLKTARALRLEIPPRLLFTASEVIE